MHLHQIKLVQFRVYASALFEFTPGINVIVGPNARGKTSLLEAIYLLIAAKSFRTHRPSEMIAFGSNGFSVEGSFIKEGVNQSIRLFTNGKEKGAIHNSTRFVNWSPVLGLINGSVLTPDDASLIKGAPQLRRQHLNILISQIDPLYIHHLGRYHRALEQRNALLRKMTTKSIEVWEQEMAISGAYLIEKRAQTIISLSDFLAEIHCQLSDNHENISLNYLTSLSTKVSNDRSEIKSTFINELEKARPKELQLGYTLIGPHKDDFDIQINKKEIRSYGSEGQQRTCISSLKIAEWQFLKMKIGEVPLMLIDDLGVSLDQNRQKKLLYMLENLGQVFLTSTDHVETSSTAHIIHF